MNNKEIELKNSKYKLLMESDTYAKRSVNENLVSNKSISYPHVSLYLRSKSQANIFLDVAKKYGCVHNVRGLVVPIDRTEILGLIPEESKNYMQFMIDPLTEIFYYGSLKKDIYSRYTRIKDIPQEVIKLLNFPNKESNWIKKEEEYSNQIDSVFLDDNIKIKLVSAVVNQNLLNDTEIIIPFSPLISNSESSLFAVKKLYELTKRIYLGGTTDVDETQGKRIALYLNVSKNVFGNDRRINEIIDYINSGEHQAIVLKVLITDNTSIKDFDYDEAFNLIKLIKTVGFYSKTKKIPTHLLCANSLGIISLINGFDSFSQPLDNHEVEKDGGGDMNIMKLKNPTVDYGRIYNHSIRDFIQHKNHISMIKRNNNILDCPAEKYCNNFDGKDISNMKRNEFWDHAKKHLIEIRNYEIDEVIQAIQNKEVRGFRSRFKYFFNQFILPE